VFEQLIPLAEQAGLPMTHVAMASATAPPGVTSAIIGPRPMQQLDDLLAAASVTSTTRSSTGSTRSPHPEPTRAPTTWPTYRPPSRAWGLRRRPVPERSAA
jgi:aryl-alcohol dehydrogenase-like predicted oxidoreductase